jgi:hypothetical protein
MMKRRGRAPLVWGGVLIIFGLLLLAENLGWLGSIGTSFWSLLLGAIALFFLVTYISDRAQWWALIPGLTLMGVAIAIFLAEEELVADHVVASIVLIGVGLPFLLIFVFNRQQTWALIPALTMAGIALGVFLEGAGIIDGTAMAGFVLGGISLGFVSIYVMERQSWWVLIPGVIIGVMAIFFLIAAAARFIIPVVIILFGLLLLLRAMGGGYRRKPATDYTAPARPTTDSVRAKSQRLPTLEEQIEAAISEESDVPEDPE